MEGLWRQTQNICIIVVQRRPNVFDVGPTLYCCYTIVYWDGGLLGEVFRQIDSQDPTVFRSYH